MPTRTGFRRWGRAWWYCRLTHTGKFLRLFVFSFVQIFAQAIEDGAIVDLGLVIALRITRRGESMGDFVFGAEAG